MYRRITIALLIGLAVIGCQRDPKVALNDKANKHRIDPADNSYCYVCHINYKSEDITEVHEKKGIGCEACHDMSDNHSSDENGLTAPDRMFATDKIMGYCTTCHSPDTLRKVRKHRKFVFTENTKIQKVCMDCHGEHRLENRTRRWNKETGILIWKDGAPIMDQAAEL
jgi:hypothetical protein